ncbi:MAG: polyhydroxyalkanoic acid system family protein [Patescibacteria group bacterium]
MANITIKIPHNKTQEEAISCVKNLLDNVKEKYSKEITNLKEEWDSHECTFSFKTKGYELSGTLIVGKMEVILDAKVPWALTFFKSKIERRIREEAQHCLI